MSKIDHNYGAVVAGIAAHDRYLRENVKRPIKYDLIVAIVDAYLAKLESSEGAELKWPTEDDQ